VNVSPIKGPPAQTAITNTGHAVVARPADDEAGARGAFTIAVNVNSFYVGRAAIEDEQNRPKLSLVTRPEMPTRGNRKVGQRRPVVTGEHRHNPDQPSTVSR
jgi:hypothetical protein